MPSPSSLKTNQKEEDEKMLKKLVEEFSDKQPETKSSSTLSKYLNSAPKFVKSGTQIGSTSLESGDEKTLYKPTLLFGSEKILETPGISDTHNPLDSSSNRKRKSNIDDFLDELSNQTIPTSGKKKKTVQKEGFLKITSIGNVTQDTLISEFSKFGHVEHCLADIEGGYAILQIPDHHDAKCALHALQKRKLDGNTAISISWCSRNDFDDLKKKGMYFSMGVV